MGQNRMALAYFILMVVCSRCSAINLRNKLNSQLVGKPAQQTITHLLKDPVAALGSKAVGTVAQAMIGPEVNGNIAKKLESLSSTPFENSKAEDQDLSMVHGRIKEYLRKLNELYSIAEPKEKPKHLGAAADTANVTAADDDDADQIPSDEMPNLKLPQLRKAVLSAAIKKAASSALNAADSELKQKYAAEEARHTAAIQNLTQVAMKNKAMTLTAKWRVQQAIKSKKRADDVFTALQTHEMKTQMAINTLKEHQQSVKLDLNEAEQQRQRARKKLRDRIAELREQQKEFESAQDDLLEEKATQIQELFEQQAETNDAEQSAKVDAASLDRFLGSRL